MSKIAASLIVSLFFAAIAYANSPFVVDATVEDITRVLGFHDVSDVIDTFTNNQLRKIFPNYNDNSPVDARVDFRGLPVRLRYGQNSTTLIFTESSCNINKSFTGNTRDDSSRQFERYIEKNGGNDLTCLLQSLASKSSIDPITGVAGSLYQTMAMADYVLGRNHSYIGTDASTPNQIGFGMRFGQYSARGLDSTVFTVPLLYTINNVYDFGFAFDLPFTYSNTDGATAYNASLGFGVRIPVSRFLHFDRDEWDITPIVRVGAAGSPELASVGVVYALGVMSHYALRLPPDFQIDISNLVSRYKTVPVSAGDLHIDYALENFVFRNGLTVVLFLPSRIPFWPFSSKKLSIKGSFTDTRFIGDDLFANSYQELALDFGTVIQKGGASWDNLRVGFQYTLSETFSGFSFNLGYTF